MGTDDLAAAGAAALEAGRWNDAHSQLEAALAEGDSAEVRFGLATAMWWLGDNRGSVEQATRAYAMFRRSGDALRAVECALTLAITYKANFANTAVANGWTRRAERLLEGQPEGPAHAFMWLVHAYKMADLDTAEGLTRRALGVSREVADVDLELAAMSQLGLILVGKGANTEGFSLIDEAMAGALAGEGISLVTVAYTCCDMLNACELAADVARAVEWCKVADGFVDTYGCPFLYAECRLNYGSVMTATGRWVDAEREMQVGLRITEGACPALHRRALARLAALRIRQGRLEDAGELLSAAGAGTAIEVDAALLLAQGDAVAAYRLLERRARAGRTVDRAAALDLLVEAHVMAGRVDEAARASERLVQIAATVGDERLAAMAAVAVGRVRAAQGDVDGAVAALERAVDTWSRLEMPFEAARAELDLGRALAGADRDLAIGHARRALAAFEQLGAALDADRVAALLRSMGVVARTGAKGVGVLTAREQEVYRLLGHGLSNPEIAERLHVSRKTAAHHVSSILSKLNLRNRAEVAADAARGERPPRPA